MGLIGDDDGHSHGGAFLVRGQQGYGVQHESRDTSSQRGQRGDGGDGSGFNVLGKLLSRLIRAQHNPSMKDFSSEGLHKPLKSS